MRLQWYDYMISLKFVYTQITRREFSRTGKSQTSKHSATFLIKDPLIKGQSPVSSSPNKGHIWESDSVLHGEVPVYNNTVNNVAVYIVHQYYLKVDSQRPREEWMAKQ